ncbi:MAG: WecB/TagA/CpsF family glycosyltransferase [Chloroflexi bacterium]|nr:WecB/TagA/CpsF family glycosyltransferase [Chloroflexota bacterium]
MTNDQRPIRNDQYATTSIQILGVRVDDVTMQDTCDRVSTLIAEGGTHQVATVNPEFIMATQHDPEFAMVLAHTALNVPDGVGVLWAARRAGHTLRERVAGVDLMRQLCGLASQYKWRTFFLGAREGVAERAAATLAFRYPGLTVVGTYAGSPRVADEQDVVARIRRVRPNLLFVAYGAPAQDKWLGRNLPLLAQQEKPEGSPPGLVGIGVGGSFDYVTGLQKRAPEWVQRIGMEWLHRLLQEPRRWRRQTALVRFALAIMLQSARAAV